MLESQRWFDRYCKIVLDGSTSVRCKQESIRALDPIPSQFKGKFPNTIAPSSQRRF